MDIYTHMVQLDMLNTDFEKLMCKKPAENHLVNITWPINKHFNLNSLKNPLVLFCWYNQRKGPLLLLSFLSDAFPMLANIWIIRILKYYSRQQNKHFGDSWSYLFQVLNLTKKGTEYDIEGGTKPRSNKKERSINQKCSEFMLKVTLTCIVMAVFIAYFVAISRSSNLIGNFQEFDVAIVTNSPLFGKVFSFNRYSIQELHM